MSDNSLRSPTEVRSPTDSRDEPGRGWRREGAACLVLLLAATAFLWDTLVGGKVLLPADDLFTMAPWRDFAAQLGIGAPHNHLIADMIVQNLSWKSFAKDAILQGTLPLWNPYLLSGVPFLAAGQYAVMYPLGAIFYLLPVAHAYGPFTALHVFLGAFAMYVFLRVVRAGRVGALVGGVTFAFSAFLVVSFVWPMVLSTAIWAPLLLTLVELTIRGITTEGSGERVPRISPWIWPLLGALVVAMQFLAGHMEISFYVVFTAGFYSACRLGVALWNTRHRVRVLAAAFALLGMVSLGTGLAAVQIVPFSEAIGANFRAGFVTYDDVAGYALPKQRAVSFLIPDFFGNPAVHSFWNVLQGGMAPAKHLDSQGREVDYVADWDRKNYVEGASYVGVLPLVLAGLALLYRRNRYTLIFAAYAVWSLLLAFGSPLYRLFFYGIPGFDQLHTPFRWIFPYTISVAALAGFGADWLRQSAAKPRSFRQVSNVLAVIAGSVTVALLAAAIWSDRMIALLQPVFERSDRLREAFGSTAAFFAFEWRNLAIFAIFLLAAAALLVAARRGLANGRVFAALLLGAVIADLFVFGYDFNTRSDSAVLDFVPPSVAFLRQDPELFRIVSVGETDLLTPNTAMRYGLQDARGYDTIIPRQYVGFWSLVEDPRGYLVYSKIHKLRDVKSLESPLLRLLNVKYVLSAQPLEVPGYELAFRGELYIYRNTRVLPRVFIVDDPDGVQIATDANAAATFLSRRDLDPARELLLDDPSAPELRPGVGMLSSRAEVTLYSPGRVAITVDSDRDGFLVLADSYFSGWQATVDGSEAKIYRAYGNFQAVYLPAGARSVLFEYRPVSFRTGLVITAVSLALLLLGLAYFARPRGLLAGYGAGPVQRVAKNSLLPMATSLANKLVSAAFAIVVLHLLGPEGVGKYTFAIIVSGYFEIFTNFGLNTLLTREVAKDASSGNRYLSNTTILRLALWVASLPLAGALIFVWREFFGLDEATALTIALLIVALAPGNLSAGLSSLFYAHERMEYPAVVSIVTTLLTVALGALALLAGWGFVGLAGVAVLTNVVTAAIFVALVIRVFWRPRLDVDARLLRNMTGTAAPLMLNHLLATVFFRIDVMLLQPMQGDRAVGYYGTAYRFVDALNIVPSAFTFAIFPLLSRHAQASPAALNRSFGFAVKLLLVVSLPVTVGTVFLAEPIILFFGGPEFLPHSAVALQLLIWFLPFSYVNSVTQYVLIALNQQRYITASFVVATTFNVAANLLLIPRYGYAGAAVVTVLSEIVLLAPFLRGVWRHAGGIPVFGLSWRPVVAVAAMALVLWMLPGANVFLQVAVGAFVYFAALIALGAFDRQERLLLRQLLRRDASEVAGVGAI